MFNCHSHPGEYTKNALVCTAKVKDVFLLYPFPYRSLGSLPGDDIDLDQIESWAQKERFIGEVGVDMRFNSKTEQFSTLKSILEIAEKNKNIVTFHQVGWTEEFLKTIFSYRLKGFIVHNYTGSYETYREISEHGGLISLSPRAEKTKFFPNLLQKGIITPFLTETDTLTGEKERETLKEWNTKLSQIFDRDIEKEVEDTFFSYIS